jgi:hypothetical protein
MPKAKTFKIHTHHLYVIHNNGEVTRIPSYEFEKQYREEETQELIYEFDNEYMDVGEDQMQALRLVVPAAKIKYNTLTARFEVHYDDVLIRPYGDPRNRRSSHQSPHVL